MGEAVPVVAAVVDDLFEVVEDAVGEPVLPHELPDVLHGVELRAFRGQGQEGDVVWDDEVACEVPAGLIEQDDGVFSGGDHGTDLGQLQGHGGGVADGQDEGGPLAVLWTDGAEDVGRGGALIARCGRPAASRRPASGDAVLLADPGLVGEPEFYRVAVDALLARNTRQRGGEVFLKASTAPSIWAWCLGRAEILR